MTSDSLVGTSLGGRYRIVSPIGRGGAGQVYLAIQEPLGREVAVKVLRGDLGEVAKEEFEARFLREAAMASRLSHPNLVTIHDFGTAEGDVRYVVMERLHGENLRVRLRRGPLDGPTVARIGAGLAKGLRHAHQAGLVHRDVKPSNIILEPTDEGEDRPVLLDFGLVKITDEEDTITKIGVYMGTPAYMAPEQARGLAHVDHRADIYALGCLLYRALTGETPFEAANALGLAMAHQSERIPSMAKRAPGVAVDPGLETIVVRCMQKEPDDRYADAGALASALEAWNPRPAPRAVAPRKRWGALVLGLLALPALGLGGLAVVAVLALALVDWSPASPPPSEVSLPVPIAAVEPEPETAPDAPPAADPPQDTDAPAAAPEPMPSPGPVPEPVPDPKAAVAVPVPAPSPRPAAKPKIPAQADTVVDGVFFEGPHASRALAFVNTASEDQIRASGIYGRGVGVILDSRPFASLDAFGATPQIGEKTVQAVYRASAQ